MDLTGHRITGPGALGKVAQYLVTLVRDVAREECVPGDDHPAIPAFRRKRHAQHLTFLVAILADLVGALAGEAGVANCLIGDYDPAVPSLRRERDHQNAVTGAKILEQAIVAVPGDVAGEAPALERGNGPAVRRREGDCGKPVRCEIHHLSMGLGWDVAVVERGGGQPRPAPQVGGELPERNKWNQRRRAEQAHDVASCGVCTHVATLRVRCDHRRCSPIEPNQFHPPVVLPALRGVIAVHRLRLTVSR